jgi:hypothetical protein
MRSALALASFLVALLASAPAHAGETVELEAPAAVQGFLRADLDRDGTTDLLVVEGRTVWIWPGRREGLPLPAPRWKVSLPADATFVDAAVEGDPALLVLGNRGIERLPLAGGEGAAVAEATIGWTDSGRMAFADLARADGTLLEPSAEGWRLRGRTAAGTWAREVPLEATREVKAPGAFLEDTTAITLSLPGLFFGPARAGAPVLWALHGDRLSSFDGERRTDYDASFLPAAGERRLADLDGDGVPDLVHADGTNREVRIAFFRTPPLPESGPGGALRPALAVLRLSGYPLDPLIEDLDADGRPDFSLTSIEIDATNVLRAVTSGKVTAHTRAFLNRRRGTEGALFGAQADADVVSDIGVVIRFGYAGNIEIKRSFTIVVNGDYDGDGRKDLAIRTAPEVLTVRAGTKEGVWEKEGRRVGVPLLSGVPDADGYAADLTGDGKDELVLVARAPPGGRDRILVLSLGR